MVSPRSAAFQLVLALVYLTWNPGSWTTTAWADGRGPDAPSSPEPAAVDGAIDGPGSRGPTPRGLVLVTLDTTRADHLGAYYRLRLQDADDPVHDRGVPQTPHLDALAARGALFARALTTSPLTLPSHASLMTGLDPPQHGVRDNGISALAPQIPTLASELAGHGYTNGAFVGSRVLDRRFGLSHGFSTYDDTMPAEQLGEYGYPERDAAAVIDAALRWHGSIESEKPFFLWAHLYDPHAPYEPPAELRRGNRDGDYAAEITFVDQQIGRLLEGLGVPRDQLLVAVVGDHGEALGEHGERTHGLLLYRGVLEIPLLLAGPGVDAGQVVSEPVSIRQVAPTLLRLLDVPPGPGDDALSRRDALPGIGSAGRVLDFVYSETWMPVTAYGWSPLVALSDERWRLVVGPRPELFDYRQDPREAHNLVRRERRQARRLRDALETRQRTQQAVAVAPLDVPADLAASLRSLGYVSGQSTTTPSTAAELATAEGAIDPKDGLQMLDELARAKELMAVGNTTQALPVLQALVAKSPDNVPFLTTLANLYMGMGRHDDALTTFRQAVQLNPHLDFLHLHLAEAHRHLEQWQAAEQEFRLVVDLNPRQASAWLGLAEILHRRGDADGERRLLEEAVAAGSHSAAIHLRLAQLESARQRRDAARDHLRQACRIAPTWHLPWLMLGQVQAQPGGDTNEARQALREAIRLAPRSREAAQARQWLQKL